MKNITVRTADGGVISTTQDDALCAVLVHLLDQASPQLKKLRRVIDTDTQLFIDFGTLDEVKNA
jgi:hypothetical protein